MSILLPNRWYDQCQIHYHFNVYTIFINSTSSFDCHNNEIQLTIGVKVAMNSQVKPADIGPGGSNLNREKSGQITAQSSDGIHWNGLATSLASPTLEEECRIPR